MRICICVVRKGIMGNWIVSMKMPVSLALLIGISFALSVKSSMKYYNAYNAKMVKRIQYTIYKI